MTADTPLRTRVALATGAVALGAAAVGGGLLFGAQNATSNVVTGSCTSTPEVKDVDAGSEITVTCTVPKPPPVTETVTATPLPTQEPAPSSSPTTTPDVPPATVTPTPSSTPTPAGWPNASNTGVPDGVTLRASGSVTVNTAGTVIDGLNINGSLTINANNVTVRNTRVTSGAFQPIKIKNGVTGVVLTDIEVDGRGATAGASAIAGPADVIRADIKGVENGWVPGTGSEMRDSWIHNLSSPGSPHYDGIQIDGGVSDILVTGNHVDLSNLGQTAAVMVDNYFGPATKIVVDRNRLRGGGYTVYADGNFNNNAVEVTYSNNRLGKGYYGYVLARRATVTWTGNVDDVTGAPVAR